MKTKIIIGLLVLALGLSLYVSFSARDVEVKYTPKVITLSNTDTIYKKIEILTLKQDTINTTQTVSTRFDHFDRIIVTANTTGGFNSKVTAVLFH